MENKTRKIWLRAHLATVCRTIALAMVCLVGATDARAQHLRDKYSEENPLKVSCDVEFFPFEFRNDNGDPDGMNIDLISAALGAPVLAGWSAGTVATASFGYVLGYVPAALLLGLLARRGADRGVASTAVAAACASTLVYLSGVPWLMAATGMDLGAALAVGVAPFLVGDALKALATAALLPASWRLLGESR